jgi:hypothetical protein
VVRGRDGDYRDVQLVVRGRDGDYRDVKLAVMGRDGEYRDVQLVVRGRDGDYRDAHLNRVFIECIRKYKVQVSLYTLVQLQLYSLLPSALHSNKCSPSHPWHSIQPNDPMYRSLCDAEQHTGLIIDLMCQSVAIQTDTQPVLSTTSYCSFLSKQL